MGFAMGINYVLLTGFTVPTEITAIGLMIGYWDESHSHVSNQFPFSSFHEPLRKINWLREEKQVFISGDHVTIRTD